MQKGYYDKQFSHKILFKEITVSFGCEGGYFFYVKKLFLDRMIFSDLINKSNRISERIRTRSQTEITSFKKEFKIQSPLNKHNKK